MSIKISELPASSGAVRTMQFEVNNGGVSERLTLAQMFALSTGAVTVDTPLLNMAQTWNAGGVTFTGWKLNVTDTASAAGSLLCDLQIGGASKFAVTKAGALALGDPLVFDTSGNPYCRFGTARFTVPLELGWSAAGSIATPDVFLARDAANTLAQRNGTSAQTFRLYDTFTDSSNYRRAALFFVSGDLYLSAQSAGTGEAGQGHLMLQAADAKQIRFYQGATQLWQFDASGHFIAGTDNTHDIGASGANRPRNINAAGKIKGQLQTHAAAASETITPNKTLTLYDSGGTAYKVPCVAA